jgi:hypothetical protein
MGKLIKGGPYSKPVKLEKYVPPEARYMDVTPTRHTDSLDGKKVPIEGINGLSNKLPRRGTKQ